MRAKCARATRLFGLLAIAAPALLSGCKKDDAAALDTVRPVLAVEPQRRTDRVFGPFAGTVEARYQSLLGFRTSGRMISRNVFVGDRVVKGQELAALDDTLLRLALLKATADVMDAEAQLKNATAAQGRKRYLNANDVVPQSQLDTADADLRTAQAKLDEANAAKVKARDNLGYTRLEAEFDGVVTDWRAEIGQEIAQGTGVVTVARPDVREAVVDIPDSLIGDVHPGDTFEVVLQASSTVTARGAVREIAPSSEGSTRTRRVRFTLDRPSDAFRLGSTTTVALTSPIPPVTEIPAAAVWDDKGHRTVWVVPARSDTITSRTIDIAQEAGSVVEVAKGIEPGDRVLVAGIHSVRSGQRVRVTSSFQARLSDDPRP